MSLKTEIFEQPQVLARLLETQRGPIEQIAQAIKARKPRYIFLAARGTSDNAGRYAKYLWGAANHLALALATPSLFSMYRQPPQLRDAVVIAISQSGQSPDIVNVVDEGRRQGCLTVAITNAPKSPLARAADMVLDIRAGEEKAVAATKTYTAQLMSIAMLSAAMNSDAVRWRELQQIPQWAESALELDEQIEQIAQRYRYMQQCVVLGRGYNYATAFEWSLKLKELAYLIAEPHSSADFQHGPIAVIERGFPVLAIAPSGAVFDDMLQLLKNLRERQQAEILALSDQESVLGQAQIPIRLPTGVPEWLSPFICIIPAQIFAYHLTRVKGYDTDSPRGLRKVTETL